MKLMIIPPLVFLVGLVWLAGQHTALRSSVLAHARTSDGDVIGAWQPNRGATPGQREYPEMDETRAVTIYDGWFRAEFEEGRQAGGQTMPLLSSPMKVTTSWKAYGAIALVTILTAAGALAIVWRATPARGPEGRTTDAKG